MTAPDRVGFAGGRSFVGTDRPVIRADGEGPRRPVRLAPFAIDVETVTNARFAAFVAATGFRTEAERFGWSAVFRGLLPQDAVPVSAARDTPWWMRIDGAFWSSPEGPGSGVTGREDHPVVQVSWSDAAAFAAWAGGRLPSEAEWEHAARSGSDADIRFPWGDAEPDDTHVHCNIWQGRFPEVNTLADGWYGTAPARSFEPNGAGLFNACGNVWEWTVGRLFGPIGLEGGEGPQRPGAVRTAAGPQRRVVSVPCELLLSVQDRGAVGQRRGQRGEQCRVSGGLR